MRYTYQASYSCVIHFLAQIVSLISYASCWNRANKTCQTTPTETHTVPGLHCLSSLHKRLHMDDGPERDQPYIMEPLEHKDT